jgi:hypothetical protein
MFYCLLDIKTIVKAIDELKALGYTIDELSERRGEKKIPTKVFKIKYEPFKNSPCLE